MKENERGRSGEESKRKTEKREGEYRRMKLMVERKKNLQRKEKE